MADLLAPRSSGPDRLRALLREAVDDGAPLVAPGCYDALGARLVEQAGFDAAYMTGFGTTAGLLGRPDVGLLGLGEMVDNARRIVSATDLPVIAADTAVVLDGEILGKPIDHADAHRMLSGLSGRRHDVVTGVAVRHGDRVESLVARTIVDFVELTDADIEHYLATDEPWDKAGAYGMQGAGGLFVKSIEGNPSNVIGLPLADLWGLCRSMGIDLLK